MTHEALFRALPHYEAMRIEPAFEQYADMANDAGAFPDLDTVLDVARRKSGNYTVRRPLGICSAMARCGHLTDALDPYGVIAEMAALASIFTIMVVITGSVVAVPVIVGTVVVSLGRSFGLSGLIWQDLFGWQLHWMVPVMSVIILLAVGYNLLLVTRFKEEIHAGPDTGIIREMGCRGSW